MTEPAKENQPKTDPLKDAELQAKYREAYLLQLSRMQCPGCGDTSPLELQGQDESETNPKATEGDI